MAISSAQAFISSTNSKMRPRKRMKWTMERAPSVKSEFCRSGSPVDGNLSGAGAISGDGSCQLPYLIEVEAAFRTPSSDAGWNFGTKLLVETIGHGGKLLWRMH